MAADDLERIIPEKIRQLGNRPLLLVQGIIIVLLLIIVIILAAYLGVRRRGPASSCATPDCLHAAALLADNMDASASPCDNFYRFACGGFGSHHHLPPDETEVTMIQTLEDDIDERLREMIENPSGGKPKTPSETKLRDFFLSCVHDYGRMREGGRVLVNLLMEKLRGWYVLDPENWSASWDLQEALEGVQGDLMVSVFFEAYMLRDMRLKKNVLMFNPSGTGMWHTYYTDDKLGVQDAYQDYMRQTAVLLLRDANVTVTPSEVNARVEQFVSDAFDMEYRLATEMSTLRTRKLLYKTVTTTLGEIDRNFTQLNWLNVVTRMFEDLSLTEESEVRLVAPHYYATINDILLNETDAHIKDRVMNNFLAWRIAHRYASDLSLEYRDGVLRYQSAMHGEREVEPTWKTCLKTVQYRLGTLLATEFIRAHLGPDARKQVSELVDNIELEITQTIQQLPWMDDATRTTALEKFRLTKALIGYSDMYYNDTAMEELHSMLQVDPSAGYFTNLLNLNRFQRRMRVKLFVNQEASFMEHMPLLGSSAHYWVEPYFSLYYNLLLIPAGAMLDPIFNARRPRVLDYGILGSMVATELLGAVGQSGRYYYGNGTYGNWWTNWTDVEFKKRSQCLTSYFDGLKAGPFVIGDENVTVPVSGKIQAQKLTTELGGIQAAYRAYKDWTWKNGKEDLPAGSSLTHEQLFFVAMAQTKCYLRTDEEAYNDAQVGRIPEELEINSLLSHMPEFSTAFQCPVGSGMRQTPQCEIF